MIKATPTSAQNVVPLPENLSQLVPVLGTPWNVSAQVFSRLKSQTTDQPFKLCEVLSSDPEYNFILKYFEHQKPVGYSIKRVVCIHNPDHTHVFEGTLKNMEREVSNPVFAPEGKEEEPKADRARVLARWEGQVAQFSPVEVKSSNTREADKCSKAKVLPLWHGSSPEVCWSICSSGFTYFGKQHYFEESASKGNNKSTDKGYFGSGIYFTNSARYASMYSSRGQLILAWISMREPYPVVNDKPHPEKGSDMKKLMGQKHYQNYNAHFIPVASIRPEDPKCIEFYPCYKDQQPIWDEFVVFYPNQTLPRFWIELGVDFPNVPISDLANNEEFFNLLIHLLDQPSVKEHADLSALLQAKADKLIELNQTTVLNAEDQKLFRLAKRLMPQEEKISPAIVNMILKSSSSPASASPISSNTPSPKIPSISMDSSFKSTLSPISVSLEEEGYQLDELKETVFNYQEAAEKVHVETPQKAEDFVRKSTERDNAIAQNNLGVRYTRIGVTQNYQEAAKCFQKAAEQGLAAAQFHLGGCYVKGLGVAQDYKEAAKWFQKAADQGHTVAQYNLGICYEKGQGVTQDHKEAVKWLQKAASKGHRKAQSKLGFCYIMGQGVAQDCKEAVKWYREAADRGDVSAQFNLGGCYREGRGIAQDYKEAVKWFQKAADQGFAWAQYQLGVCYIKGRGVAKDYKEAVKWFQKAADQGYVDAKTYVERLETSNII